MFHSCIVFLFLASITVSTNTISGFSQSHSITIILTSLEANTLNIISRWTSFQIWERLPVLVYLIFTTYLSTYRPGTSGRRLSEYPGSTSDSRPPTTTSHQPGRTRRKSTTQCSVRHPMNIVNFFVPFGMAKSFEASSRSLNLYSQFCSPKSYFYSFRPIDSFAN